MKVALVSAEAYPFSKTGGLGEVVGALFKEFIRNGLDVTLFLPYYRVSKNKFHDKVSDCGLVYGVSIGLETKFGATRSAKVSLTVNGNLLVEPSQCGNLFFVEHNDFFDREQIYGTSYGEYLDNAERFVFFSRGFLEICKILNLNFDIIHCNDWHTALIPLYMKTFYREFFKKTKTILTIHNLGYQGVFPREKLEITGFGAEIFHIDGIEFYGMINFLKGGIFYSDYITTVSPTYAKEILTAEYGFGLDGVLRKRKESLTGIINGIDYNFWDPSTDPYIFHKYSVENFFEKRKNKEELIRICELNVSVEEPLLGFIGRLTSQKGIDIMIEVIPKIIDKVGFIVVGTGESYYENKIIEIKNSYPSRIFAFLGFNEELAHRIYAGIDAILIPSKYEPCGLSQLISMKYGTIPICRKTGGLADTVEDGITGFLFEKYDPYELCAAIDKFLNLYQNKSKLYETILECMKKDFSWEKSCKDYIKLYEALINERNTSNI